MWPVCQFPGQAQQHYKTAIIIIIIIIISFRPGKIPGGSKITKVNFKNFW